MSDKREPKPTCCFCHLPRADRECPLCENPICRQCVEPLSEEFFRYLASRPAELGHPEYCPPCFDATVAPAAAAYSETLERAKNVGYWPRTYKGHVPIIKKGLEILRVEGCRDRDDALMRLGFMAAERGFNGLIQGELSSKKERDHGYQKMLWSGHALPAKIDDEKLERAEFNEAHWRVIYHR